MPFDFASFINPAQFSDAATIAGFDPNKSMRGLSEAAFGVAPSVTEAVAPPDQSFGDVMGGMAKQAVAPYQQKFDKLSGAASQVSEGNFGNAANVMLDKKIHHQTTMPQHDYSYEW